MLNVTNYGWCKYVKYFMHYDRINFNCEVQERQNKSNLNSDLHRDQGW